ncbi:hypothetical protein ACT4R9_02345 [Ornithobacterium rhinotracheale]|uniref:hypothetical protein n=1 Tax=Ornithobacterium rhinotracheale TaxID=28251 RepID=UPI003FA41E46
MKQVFYKFGALAMLFVGAGVYSQEIGRVGVNTTSPKATLDVEIQKDNEGKDTNEGIVAPKLTKTRLAAIADKNLIEGTLVYVTDVAYTANSKNDKVSKVDSKGYYFYDGDIWVKVSDVKKNGREWVYNGKDAIYAKKALENNPNHKIEILNNGTQYTQLGNVTDWKSIIDEETGQTLYETSPRGVVPLFLDATSEVLPEKSPIKPNSGTNNGYLYPFEDRHLLIKEDHIAKAFGGNKKLYSLRESHIKLNEDTKSNINILRNSNFHLSTMKNSASSIDILTGTRSSVYHKGKGSVGNLNALESWAGVDHNQGKLSYLRGVLSKAHVGREAYVDNVLSGLFLTDINSQKNPISNVRGITTQVNIPNTVTSQIKNIIGTDNEVRAFANINYEDIFASSAGVNYSPNQSSASIKRLFTHRNFLQTGDNGNVNIPLAMVNYNEIRLGGAGSINTLVGTESSLYNLNYNLNGGASGASSVNIQDYYAFRSTLNLPSEAYRGKINKTYDFFAAAPYSSSIANQYGVYIEGAKKINYFEGKVGIGTQTPEASLDVAGTVKIVDGTQGAGKVLTSDSKGNASWETPTMSYAYATGGGERDEEFPGSLLPANVYSTTNKFLYTGMKITLPTKGKYAVLLDLNISLAPSLDLPHQLSHTASYDAEKNRLKLGEAIDIRGTFWDEILPEGIESSRTTGVPMKNKANSMYRGVMYFPSFMKRVSNTMYIENPTSGPKTFYFYANAQIVNPQEGAPTRYVYELGSSRWAEESLVAFKIGE